MFIKSQLLIALVATTASVFGLASSALAGEGGAAAGAAFSLDSAGKVTGVAVSAAVGKQDAYANAQNTLAGNAASALGSAGTITVSNSSAQGFSNVSGSQDQQIGVPQANTFTVEVNAIDSPTLGLGSN